MPRWHFPIALLIGCSILACKSGQPSNGARITISAIPWETMTNRALRADDVRSNPHYRLSVFNQWDIEQITRLIPEQHMVPASTPPSDIRLVIDIYSADGSKQTYIANKFTIFTGDLKRQCEMTPALKKLFNFKELELLRQSAT